MKLREYLKGLNDLVDKHPEYLNLDVITAKDAEGNGYEMIYYGPSVGVFNDYDFCPKSSEDFEEEYEYTESDINAICVN